MPKFNTLCLPLTSASGDTTKGFVQKLRVKILMNRPGLFNVVLRERGYKTNGEPNEVGHAFFIHIDPLTRSVRYQDQMMVVWSRRDFLMRMFPDKPDLWDELDLADICESLRQHDYITEAKAMLESHGWRLHVEEQAPLIPYMNVERWLVQSGGCNKFVSANKSMMAARLWDPPYHNAYLAQGYTL